MDMRSLKILAEIVVNKLADKSLRKHEFCVHITLIQMFRNHKFNIKF